jgi:hypothetical protein
VKITNVNYYEKELDIKKSWFTKFKKALTEIFIPEEEFYYNPAENDKHFA